MKIIKVEKCKYCPNIHKWENVWGVVQYSCSKKCVGISDVMEKIENIDITPIFCPLENYEGK